ncbi:MAG: hypothetical protein KC996_00430 [Phycisphaerales bacterium]|nr:hypothetical protein [Phycisphaerales bacterium]
MDPSPQPTSRTIRFCVNNPPTLTERNDLIARGFVCRDCLGNCSACFEGRFLEIDSEFIEGGTYDEILQNASTPIENDRGAHESLKKKDE